MVVELALEPREMVKDIRARRHAVPDAPAMLKLPVGDRLPPVAVHDHPAVQAMHEDWLRAHDTQHERQDVPAGLRGSVKDRVAQAARQNLEPTLRYDRALIGDLIRATDVIAQSCDALGRRVADLEDLVEEIVRVVSEDVIRLRAVLVDVVGARETTAGRGDVGSPAGPAPGAPAGDG